MNYFVIPNTGVDHYDLPTTPEPMPLERISGHLLQWLGRYRQQGYYSNVRQERIPLDSITFQIVPEPRPWKRGT
jgi:hypothetical protein